MSPDVVNGLLDALQDGLEDYTIDERGDVGSWIRMACLRGLTSFSEILILNSSTIPSFEQYFPASKYQMVIGGILRQGVERLDNVRQEAGECFMRLLCLPAPTVGNSELWLIKGRTLIDELFTKWVSPNVTILEKLKPVYTVKRKPSAGMRGIGCFLKPSDC
jgi:hypothetical protein